MPRNINDLDDRLLARVFGELAVRDLLRLELVCRQWKQVLVIACSEVRRLAILSVGPPPAPPAPVIPQEVLDRNMREWQRFGQGALNADGLGLGNFMVDNLNIGGLAGGNLRPGQVLNDAAKKGPLVPATPPLIALKLAHNRFGVKFAANFDRIKVDDLTEKNCKYLVERFPNITELEIVEKELTPIIEFVVGMISEWQNLTKLTILIAGSPDANAQEAWNMLAISINSLLPLLRHLTLYDHHQGCPQFDQLTNLFNLEEYVCNGFKVPTAKVLFSPLESMIAIRSLSLTGINFEDFKADDIVFPQQAGQMRKLAYCPEKPVGTLHHKTDLLNLICNNFYNLESLHLGNTIHDFSSLYTLVILLAPLQSVKLRELRLFYNPKLLGGQPTGDWQSCGKPALTGVAKLHLDCDVLPHVEFEVIDKLMPNLVEITVDGYDKGCHHVTEADYENLGKDCFATLEAYREWSDKIPNKRIPADEKERDEERAIKRCEDSFFARPVLTRLRRLREVKLGKHTHNASLMSYKDPLLVHYRVASFIDGRKRPGSVKFVSL